MPHIHTSTQPGIFGLGFGHYTCNWGAHICGLYRTKEDRDEIIYNYLHAGLMMPTDFCLVGVEEEEMEGFYQHIDDFYPEERAFIHNSEESIISTNESIYYPEGDFSPWKMEESLNATYQKAHEKGYQNVRATADMIWAKKAISGKENLMAYEARLNMFVKDKKWSSVCLYDTTRFSGAIILQALQTHPFMINNGVVTENPFYTDPEELLKENALQLLG